MAAILPSPTVPDDDTDDFHPSLEAAAQVCQLDDLPWTMWEDRLGTSEPVNQIAADVATDFRPHLDIETADGQEFTAHQMLATLLYRCTMQEPLLSMERLASHLVRYPGITKRLDLPRDNQPSADTLRWWWYEKLDPEHRARIEHFAADAAAPEVADRGEGIPAAEGILVRHQDDDADQESDIPEEHRLETAERDRVFNEFRGLFDEVIDYGRGPNTSIDISELNGLATFTARRRETMKGGRDVYVRENPVTDGGYMHQEAYAKPIREYSRRLAEQNYMRNNAVLPNKRSYDWSVNPEDRDYGEGESWHKRTERGIGKQVEMLQERGMLDRPVDICIDGTARLYHNRNDTDVEEPDGVLHRYPKYETGYAYEDITVTAIYRGRAIVLASISKVKSDERFQCVRYLIDRARDLVNVRNVYADSEFGTRKICSYITHNGLDYVIKKRKTRGEVKEFVTEEAEGRADWKNYELEGDDHTKHKTTLVALEKTSKAVTKKGEQRKEREDDGDEDQTTLPGMDDPDADEEDDEEEIVREPFITSFDVEARGLEPEGVGPRRGEATAFGVGQLYRKRWSIETAFRDIKRNFKGKPRTRCLGLRRYFMMLCLLLYNCWVLLNLIVADEVEHREDDEIVWRKKTFIIDIHNEVFSDREYG